MAKPLKSQWEFGELFPAEAVRKTLTVSELTGSVRRALEKHVGSVSVLGEITNLRAQPSGHVYFTLKDAVSQVACVLFRNEARGVQRDYLRDGQNVVIDGTITVYEARGQYQLQVFSLQLQGLGALQAAFEKLKEKLRAEGLFDSQRKRPLPRYPRRMGVVTSPAGAAIQDVLHGVERRSPGLEVVLAPCRVQGAGSGQEIAAAIELLNDWAQAGDAPRIDLILVTRGGGSLEDLWAFNEEVVARAIYSSRLPVISAVGHEIDFTISDFVADVRAATPTAAAEIITEGYFSARPFVAAAAERLLDLVSDSLHEKRESLDDAARRLARLHPQRRLHEQAQRLDDLQTSLNWCGRHHLRQKQTVLASAADRLLRARPHAAISRRRERLGLASGELAARVEARLQGLQGRLQGALERLRLLSPEHVLKRGYSITRDATGRVVRDVSQVSQGAVLKSRLATGEITSVVTGLEGR